MWHRTLKNRQIAENLALHATQRRAFSHWRDCILMHSVIISKYAFLIDFYLLVFSKCDPSQFPPAISP